jgi:hypothetical protein
VERGPAARCHRVIGEASARADLPAERFQLIHAVYERIVVAGAEFVNARLTPAPTGTGWHSHCQMWFERARQVLDAR